MGRLQEYSCHLCRSLASSRTDARIEDPMIIAEYTLDHPTLRQTLRRVPGVRLTWEDSYSGLDGRIKLILWIGCDDFDALDAALDADPTVADPTVLTEVGGRRLYRFDLVGEAAERSIFPTLIEVGGVHQDVTATSDGWRNRTRFPDREAFERVYRFCREHGIGFEFNRIYERSELFGPEVPEVSDAQLATLIEAVDSGYLDIPRGASLEELGERLGISQTAASERFRRAVKNLVQHTVYE